MVQKIGKCKLNPFTFSKQHALSSRLLPALMQSRALLDGQLAGCGDLDFSFGLVTGGGLAVFNFPVAKT
jgi:hypothetical protein